jgi:crotonobetainyl-CoA:carnitine CoA-transferase CaiB-like acyl-CoA transferase
VLRLDPPDWDEPALAPDVTLGKRCARIDLRTPAGRDQFEALLGKADALVHGYRAGALDARVGDAARRQSLRPGLVEVCLDAYGWTGPWRGRRGFDSLVQMSCGIAGAGMTRLRKDKPFPLPVQALDHACGYLMAAAALTGLSRRRDAGNGSVARLSLARVAALLTAGPEGDPGAVFAPAAAADFAPVPEETSWGPQLRLRPPVTIAGKPLLWDSPAAPLGSAEPAWR